MTLYSKYVYMPASITNLPKMRYENITVNQHVLEAMEDEGVPFFSDVEFNGENILEIEIVERRIKYMLLEFPYDEKRMLHVALKFVPKKYSVTHEKPPAEVIMKTIFLRQNYNFYKTVNKNKSEYYCPINM